MLHEFITENRAELIARCDARTSTRPPARAADAALVYGVAHFLAQLRDVLLALAGASPTVVCSGTERGNELALQGFTVAEVVQDYGAICQAITELSCEQRAVITNDELHTLHACLDDALAGAVTEHARMRDHEGAARRGRFAHDLRNQLNSAMLSYEVLAAGDVAMSSATGSVLGRSLAGLEAVINRELSGS